MAFQGIYSDIVSRVYSDLLRGILLAYTLTFFIYSDILSGIYPDSLSGIYSRILFGIYSDILSGIHSGILFGTYSDILSGSLCDINSDFPFSILFRILTGMSWGPSAAHGIQSSWCSGQAQHPELAMSDVGFGSRLAIDGVRAQAWPTAS